MTGRSEAGEFSHMDSMDDSTFPGASSIPVSATASATSQGKQLVSLDPESDLQSPSSADAYPPQNQQSKRRRGVGLVTPNACNECRKKRVKCDGHKPCGRCKVQATARCVYELPVRQSKEDLRNEIENLRRGQRFRDSVLSALTRPELVEEVVHRLQNGESVEEISEWLDGGPPLGLKAPSIVSIGGSGILPPPFNRHGQPILSSTPTAPSYSPGGPGGVPTPASNSVGGGSGPTAAGHIRGQAEQHTSDSTWGMGDSYATGHSQAASTCSNSFQDWTPSMPPQSRVGSWAGSNSPSASSDGLHRGLDQIITPITTGVQVPASYWTTITGDSHLVRHLLALYFCWEYPTFASLSKEHFLQDFQSGSERYCSQILVNALLSLGCRFSTQPNTRADPDNPYSSGDHFFKECQSLLTAETDHHSFTTIQALGIMSIREASCGRDSESWFYAGQSIKLAIEMGLHHRHDASDEEDIAVQAATFWGAFALDHAWSLATGTLPQCSCFSSLPPKPPIIDDIEASLWIPYTDGGTPLGRSCQQPSNVRSEYSCFCELSELVHQSLYILHTPDKPLNSRDLLNMYTQYLQWYNKIPEALRLGRNFTPAVLFAHMYYHFAILLLFRPLIKLRIIGSSVLPRDVCLQAADAIQGLLRSYSRLYTLQRTPSFVPYFVLTSSIMHLAIGATSLGSRPAYSLQEPRVPKSEEDMKDKVDEGHAIRLRLDDYSNRPGSRLDAKVVESINRGINDLTEMVPCHHFAEQALNILRFLARKWNIGVNIFSGSKVPGHGYSNDDREKSNDNENRSVQPMTESLNFFAPNVREQDYQTTLSGRIEVVKCSAAVGEAINDDAENPLFWPFPLQGRPILSSGEKLEEAGFTLI